jgi:hypothetical protein
LNCGFLKPAEREKIPDFNYRRFALILLPLFVLSFFFLFLIPPPQNRIDSLFIIIFFALVISLPLAAIFTAISESFDVKNNHANQKHANRNNLKTKKAIIKKRVSELNKRGQKIDAVLDKIKATDGDNLQEVRKKLLSAREIVMSQFARYELQRQKIELVRMQNRVSPYLFGLHRLSEPETENGLLTLENTQFEINKLRRNLTSDGAIDFPARAEPEKQAFLAQLRETEESYERLRESLLSRQAARALQDISPLEENLKLPRSKELTRESEVFNIQATLTDFSESFEELEREYRRLKAEEETEQKLLAE